MFVSKFVRLGARAMKIRAVRAPMFSPATSFSMDHNQYSRDLAINQILNAMDTPKFIKYKKGDLGRHVLFCTTAAKLDSEEGDEEPKRINVTFVDKIGAEMHAKVPEGFSMLEAAQDNDIDLEGACEGSLACSTCHVIVMDVDHYNKLPDPTDEENDMLDLAFGLTDTSRLGCQIIAKPELDGLRLALPSATCNLTL